MMRKLLTLLLAALLCLGAAAETGDRALSRLSVSRNGDIAYNNYEIIMVDGTYQLRVNEGAARHIEPASVAALMDVVNRYDLYSWDGFDRETPYVLDGEMFWLEIDFTDGTSICAHGNNAFPPNYYNAMGAMWDILEGLDAGRSVDVSGILDFLTGLIAGEP